ncbi:MAG TPA: tetratricopeptide repeat protein, partial [Burkholderiaceae bacterium]
MHTRHTLGETRRALLLTDVVDSTRISLAAGEAETARMWAAHDRAARDLLQVWHGREIDKTDGLLAVFDRAADAAAYAIAYHRALAALDLPFKARVGIHVGALTLRENSAGEIERGAKRFEVDGMAKPIVARVMGTALGGQTLISADARDALALEALDGHGAGSDPGASGTAMRIESHGHWRFKGLSEPIELFEIGDDTAPFVPPPDESKAYRVVRRETSEAGAPPALLWQPVREIKHSLPAERDSFVGRDEPLRLLADKLDSPDVRLVSVLGIGGTGKTRFVTRYAWTWLGDYPGGVWFCDLAAARTLDGIYFGVAQGLDVPLGRTDPAVQLAHAIAGRGECLVIFDNFEQVAKHAEETVGRWLDRAPRAKFVVTTREVLGIVGEQMLMLDPLPGDDAAELFIRRARAAKHDFRVRDDDGAAIHQLVKVLDGLPLAIELAASRVRAMTPRVLLSRMSERFDVLMSRAGRNDRQATLRAALDWSWELLSDAERSCLAQISVFEGGFTLDAASAVVEADPAWPGIDDLLVWLVDKSLLFQSRDQRFSLLETVKEYASDHLETTARAGASMRHWRYFGSLSETAAVRDQCAEADNLVAACRRATAAGQPREAVDCLLNAAAVLYLTGPFRLAADLAKSTASLPELESGWRAKVAWVAGVADEALGRGDSAREHFEYGLSVAGEQDLRIRARLLLGLADHQIIFGEHEPAKSSLAHCLLYAEQMQDVSLKAYALNSLGQLAGVLGQFDHAREHYMQALDLVTQLGDRRREGGLLNNLGGLCHEAGDHAAAAEHYQRAIALADEVGDARWKISATSNLGLLCKQQGKTAEALTRFRQALQSAREIGHVRAEHAVLCNL